MASEHTASVQELERVVQELERARWSYNLCVMVDNYTFQDSNDTFSYDRLLEWLHGRGAKPHFLTREAELVPATREVLALIEEPRRRRDLERYIERKQRYPCSLFVAAWYLSRLGRLKRRPDSVLASAQGLINILPERFRPYEDEARKIILATPHRELVAAIRNVYLVEAVKNSANV